MIHIDVYSRIPIYQQIINSIKNDILHDWLKDGDTITSIRELSVNAGINPNTVAKAYAELERQGILSVVPGKGYFVSNGTSERMKNSLILEEKEKLLTSAKTLLQNGVSQMQLKDWISKIEFIQHEKEERQ